jgi:hypothetical protein
MERILEKILHLNNNGTRDSLRRSEGVKMQADIVLGGGFESVVYVGERFPLNIEVIRRVMETVRNLDHGISSWTR